MIFKALISFYSRDGRLRSTGGLLDPSFYATDHRDAAHKALHRATPFVRDNARSVEVTTAWSTPGAPEVFGHSQSFHPVHLMGEAA